MKYILLLLLCSCSANTPQIPACSISMVDKKDFTGTETHETQCNCNCPPSKTNVLELGGIVGGLANLFSGS